MPGATSLYNFRYPLDGEPIADWYLMAKQNADSFEAALAAKSLPPADLAALVAAGWFSDTGWIDIPLIAPFVASNATTEKPQVRKRAGLLIFQGGLAPTGMSAGGNHIVGTVPTGMRPGQHAYVGCGSSSGAATATLYLATTGALAIRPSATLGSWYKLDALSGIMAG